MWATIRFTPFFSTKIWKGSRTLRLIVDSLCDRWFGFANHLEFHLNLGFRARIGWTRRLGGFCLFLGLVNRSDHVKGAFGIILELILQDALTAVDRVLEADVLSLDAAELLGREKRLGQKSL